MSNDDTLNPIDNTDTQNTESNDVLNSDETLESTNEDVSIDTGTDTDDSSNEDDSILESTEDDVTQEQLDALNDDEFLEFLNSGNLPERLSKSKKGKEEKVEVETEVDKPTPNKAKIISKPEKTETIANKEEAKEIDYKAVYETLFKPFKANGKEITPRNVEDIISLMQMGANYTKKMQLMAPMKRAMESLNQANIKEEDLSFLIDIHKGDKEAIKKLLQNHKIDPIDLDLDDTNYKPRNNIASDADVEFSDTLMDIESSLPKIQDIINKQWDAKSKAQVLKDPKLMRALHEEIEMGRFDVVQQRLEIEKTFGRYKGMSDIEAYIDLVTKMVQEASINDSKTAVQSTKETKKPDTNTKNIPDKSKAAPVKAKAKNQGTSMTVKDLFSMSDEEFDKLKIKDLI